MWTAQEGGGNLTAHDKRYKCTFMAETDLSHRVSAQKPHLLERNSIRAEVKLYAWIKILY
jgi:hypothetical protein